MLFDGWVPGQAGFTFLSYWGGGEDAQALKGSERAGWDVTVKTYKFLSCPPAWATPAFFAPYFRGESVRKNRPLVPRSNIAGSWARGVEGILYFWDICAVK